MRTEKEINDRINTLKITKSMNDLMIISWMFIFQRSSLQESNKKIDSEIRTLEWVLNKK